MNSLFGDATSVMPTPETLAEAESLFSASRSPVPSLDIRARHTQATPVGGGPAPFTADSAIPGLDIDPPQQLGRGKKEQEGLGGWITNMIGRLRGEEDGASQGEYQRVPGMGEMEEDDGNGEGDRDGRRERDRRGVRDGGGGG